MAAYIIAEIGTSHGGDRKHLAELIKKAAWARADCAKFQWVYADEILHPASGIVPLPGGPTPLYDRFKTLEVGADFFQTAKQLCAEHGIDFLCTPFGFRSARELQALGVGSFKLASPELNHLPLAELLSSSDLPLIVSSGVSTLADIDETLAVIRQATAGTTPLLDLLGESRLAKSQPSAVKLPPVTLLHCLTSYPAPEEEYNLLLVRTLAGIFGVPVGISDHSLDPILVPVVSALLGGTIIEKHFTLENDTDGLDDPIALSPKAFKSMVRAVRQAETLAKSWRERNQRVNLTIEAIYTILVNVGPNVSEDRVKTILGTGTKQLAASEAANYGRTNRSLHILHDQKAGTKLDRSMIGILRTEKVLRPGLHPRHLPQVLGQTLKRPIAAGEGIVWEDILG